jgi:gamma-glutamyltranspeptidase/glutathione hydrolase
VWQVSKQAVSSTRGVVAAQHRRAAEIGAEILGAGGNAVDAAIVASLALAALEPWMSGLGGGGCVLYREAATGRTHALDFGMVAPQALDPADYPLTGGTGGDLFGWPAVPRRPQRPRPARDGRAGPGGGLGAGARAVRDGAVRGAGRARNPAGEEGLAADWFAGLLVAGAMADLARYPDDRRVWLPDGAPPQPAPWGGEPRRVPCRAWPTPCGSSRRRVPSLYRGGLASALAPGPRRGRGRNRGRRTSTGYEAALAGPLRPAYRDAELALMPVLYAGGVDGRCWSGWAPGVHGPDGPAGSLRRLCAALTAAYAERIDGAAPEPAPSCTSHLSVVDRHGNLVALTQTLLSLFGSKVLLPRTGILMNNGVMWFDPRPGRPNSLAPAKRPLSNMCPAVASRGGEPFFALGASGGRRILPAVLQVASFLTDFRMPLEAALASRASTPRAARP